MKQRIKAMAYILILTCLVVFSNTLGAQEKISPDAQALLKSMMTIYSNQQQLSFDIRYRYSTLEKPDIFIDSISGHFAASGGKIWYQLDSTTTISNTEMTIMIFEEDRLLYLTRPADTSIRLSPIAFLDSLLLRYAGMTGRVEKVSGSTVLHLEFPEKSIYKKADYYFAKGSSFPTRVRCLAPGSLLVDPGVQTEEGIPDWIWIDIDFGNVSTRPVDNRRFLTSTYLEKRGKEFFPVAPYNDYKVFIGSPELTD